MPTRHAATTRTTRSLVHPFGHGRELLAADEVVVAPASRARFRVERLLGQGGFGQVFLVRRLSRSTTLPEKACIKVSHRIDGWLREAYFGLLLDDHPRAIRVFEAFPLVRDDGSLLYALVLEYAPHGDLGAHLARHGCWREAAVRREIAGVLQVLGKLHRGSLLHRDLTPLNVFVCDRQRLKLGDFGIVRQQTNERGITASTMNTMTAPSDIIAGIAPKWQARDDVYQVGQVLAMLVRGTASARIRTPDVRKLACSDSLKEIIYRCIGERRKRYESADELIEALRKRPEAFKVGRLRSLKGVHLAFTGILSRKRSEAVEAAKRAGAIVHGGPSALTSVVVRGRPNPQQAAGDDAGRKLMEIKRLRDKGLKNAILNEAQFWRLVMKG